MKMITSKKGKLALIVVFAVLIVIIAVVLLSSREERYRIISISELFGNVMAEDNGRAAIP